VFGEGGEKEIRYHINGLLNITFAGRIIDFHLGTS
jgi:hypothetical protein